VDKVHEEEVDLQNGFLLLLLVAFLCIFMLYAYHRISALEYLPESIAAVLVGIVIGGILKYFYENNGLIQIISFEPHTFFLFLLPPIMF